MSITAGTIQDLKEIIKNMAANAESSSGNYNCRICKDEGFIIVKRTDGQPIMRKCECGMTQRQIMDRRLSFANIPETFKGLLIENFGTEIFVDVTAQKRAETAVKAVKYWLENFDEMHSRGMGLYFYSTTKGSGKTRMAVSIANEIICGKNKQAKFATSLQILNEIKATWDSDNAYTESRLLSDLSETDVLIIDDFGTENGEKDWINERFYHVINSRYIGQKITIFTSNSRLDALRYDDRITNRIKERTFQIPFPEESVRDIIAKRNKEELINGVKGMIKGGESGDNNGK